MSAWGATYCDFVSFEHTQPAAGRHSIGVVVVDGVWNQALTSKKRSWTAIAPTCVRDCGADGHGRRRDFVHRAASVLTRIGCVVQNGPDLLPKEGRLLTAAQEEKGSA